MTNEEAKRILSAYRPDGEDAGDRYFEDALKQAERDPEMSLWFDEQRKFDHSVAAALQGIEVPAEAKRETMTAVRMEAKVRPFPRWIAGLAAALVLTGGLVFAWLAFGPTERWATVVSGDGPVRYFAEMTAQAMPFDYRADSVGDLSVWLQGRGAPYPNGLPESMGGAEAVGCQVFEGADGRTISLLCLVRNGEFVHLFVTEESHPAFADFPRNTWIEEEGWNAYSWQREGRGYVALSRAPRGELEPWFDEV